MCDLIEKVLVNMSCVIVQQVQQFKQSNS